MKWIKPALQDCFIQVDGYFKYYKNESFQYSAWVQHFLKNILLLPPFIQTEGD